MSYLLDIAAEYIEAKQKLDAERKLRRESGDESYVDSREVEKIGRQFDDAFTDEVRQVIERVVDLSVVTRSRW